MKTKLIASVLTLSALAGCATDGSNYRPVVDEPVTYGYGQDLASCKSLAETKRLTGTNTRNQAIASAAIGGLLGAVIADDGDEGEGAIAGLAVGGLIGAGKGAIEINAARKQIVINCMKGRGHRVVG